MACFYTLGMRTIVLIAHDIRSCHNVGSLLRTAEGLGVQEVWLTGYTPYPHTRPDSRLPHIAAKLTAQIKKTALGAEDLVTWHQTDAIFPLLKRLKDDGYVLAALEQTSSSLSLPDFKAPEKIALLLGREVEGIQPDILKLCDATVEIPMFGQKESFNVVQAAAMALFHIRFSSG